MRRSASFISRDILMYAMKMLRCCSIVAHVHDELIIEADKHMSLDAVCEQMGRTPPWVEGLLLRRMSTRLILQERLNRF